MSQGCVPCSTLAWLFPDTAEKQVSPLRFVMSCMSNERVDAAAVPNSVCCDIAKAAYRCPLMKGYVRFRAIAITSLTTGMRARSRHSLSALRAPRKFHDYAGCQCIFGFLASLLNRRHQLTLRVVRHPDDGGEYDGLHEIGMHSHCPIRAAGSSSGFRLRSTNDRRLAVSTSVELPSLMTSTSPSPMST